MPISFPKQVSIVNRRLDICQIVLLTLASLAFALRFYLSSQYSRFIDVGEDVNVVLWVEGFHDMNKLAAKVEQNKQALYCQSPEVYDYWWDREGLYRFDDHKCMDLCAPDTISHDCIHADELPVVEPSSVFLATQISSQLILHERSEIVNYFLPTVEALKVGLIYSFKVGNEGFFDFGTPGSKNRREDISDHSCTTDILTVILDAKGEEWQSYKPPLDAIYLTADEILELAGYKGALDQPNRFAGDNWIGGVKGPPPISRITGLQVRLKVECYNYRPIRFKVKWDDEHVCYVSAQLTSSGWTWLNKLDALNDEGEIRLRVWHGLRVKSVTGGYFQFPDSNNILLNITAAVVFMRVVRSVMLFVAVSCLGHLSKIYRHAIYEEFLLTEQVGSMATHMMASSVNFSHLKDQSDETGGTISRPRMTQQLKQIMRHRRDILNEAELESFASFCFRCVVDRDFMQRMTANDGLYTAVDDRRSGIPYLWRLLTGRERKTTDEHLLPAINIDSFNIAYTAQSLMAFEDIVQLFDRDRYVSFQEVLFLPREFKVATKAALQLIAREKEKKEHGDHTHVQVKKQRATNLADMPVEERICHYEDSLQQIDGLAENEHGRVGDADKDAALKIEARISQMEGFLDVDLAERLMNLDPASSEVRAEEWKWYEYECRKLRMLEARASQLAEENHELREQCNRLEEPDAEHLDSLKTIAFLQAHLLVLEEEFLIDNQHQPLQDEIGALRPVPALPLHSFSPTQAPEHTLQNIVIDMRPSPATEEENRALGKEDAKPAVERLPRIPPADRKDSFPEE